MFIPMQFPMQNSDWQRILLSDSTPAKADLFHTIYCLNYFAKMLSGRQSYMESNSASNWYSFQCNLQCRIQLQTGIEFCWLTQHLQKQICSTLLCTIYCLNYFWRCWVTQQNSCHVEFCIANCIAMQNSDRQRILLSDSTPPKADLFHSTMHNLLSKLLC